VNVEHEMFCHTDVIGTTGIVTKGQQNMWKKYRENIQ
jgi:hypothetical protein